MLHLQTGRRTVSDVDDILTSRWDLYTKEDYEIQLIFQSYGAEFEMQVENILNLEWIRIIDWKRETERAQICWSPIPLWYPEKVIKSLNEPISQKSRGSIASGKQLEKYGQTAIHASQADKSASWCIST